MEMTNLEGLTLNFGVAYSIKLLLKFGNELDVRLWQSYILALVMFAVSKHAYSKHDIDSPFLTWVGFAIVGLVVGLGQLFINL